jgi:peptidyl-prolyl cis-trans isomerase A (cyclophilin A)
MTKTSVLTVVLMVGLSACAKTTATNASGSGPTGEQAPAAPKTAADLDPAKLKEQAPATFSAKFDTSKGAFTIKVTREWAPNGADRFYNLVKNGYYNDVRFFRVLLAPVPFMAQFGIHGDPAVSKAWRDAKIVDDPVKQSNKRGFVSYAMAGPGTRTTQIFINFGNNLNLDGMGFSPFGEVIEGMSVVDSLYGEYGEGSPRGGGPDQGRMQAEGNAYLSAAFPKLDYVKSVKLQ